MNRPEDIIKDDISQEPEVRSLVPSREPSNPQLPYGDGDWNSDERLLSLHDYWLMVRNRLWLILAITILVTTLSVIYVAQQPDVYKAEARIQVDLQSNPAIGGTNTGSPIIGDETAYLNTQILLLKSPAFLRRVVKTLNLEQQSNAFSWESGRHSSAWANILTLVNFSVGEPKLQNAKPLRASSIAPPSDDGDMSDAQNLGPYVATVKNGLDVKLSETSRLISITYTSSNPTSAAKVVNVIADTFVKSNWEHLISSTSSAGEFLVKRIDDLKIRITENEKWLIEYAKEHGIFPLDAGKDIDKERFTTLDRSLLDAENARKAAESEYQAAMAPGAAAAIVEASNNPQISSIDSRLADLRQRRAVMLIDVGENWPEVKEFNKQIADSEAQLKQTVDRAITVVLTNLETRYRQALSREQSLRKAFEQTHSEALAQNESAINYRMIQQETVTYRGLLESLQQRSKENEVLLAATPNNVHVTDYATSAGAPVGPRRSMIVLIAFAASLVFGIGFAVIVGSFEDSIRVDSFDRVESAFGLPSLAIIPDVKRQRLHGFQMLQKRNGNGSGELLVHYEKQSPLAESFKKLRTSLLLSGPNQRTKTLLVTSSLPGEGKTTAVFNLGKALAQTGAKVLLIDADLRHPGLHKILGAPNEHGLTTILSSGLNEAEAYSMIEQHEESSLYFLPSGSVPENPAELLASQTMRSLLKTLNSTFTHIIIDSPPISFFTDAVLVSSVVDGVLMIVRGPKIPRQVARYSIRSLDSVGAPILGIVLNAVNVRNRDYSYYRNYYR